MKQSEVRMFFSQEGKGICKGKSFFNAVNSKGSIAMQIGRTQIYTREEYIDENNVIPVLQQALAEHQANANRIDFLLKYEAGNQPLQRKKKYKTYIDIRCIDNVANEVTEFNLGFKWSNPITLIQCGSEGDFDSNILSGVAELNRCYDAERIKAKTQRLARFVEIAGIGYTFVDLNTEYAEGESYFKVEALDPRTTFIVRSSYYIDRRPMLGVTYREDSTGTKYFTCFTKDAVFIITDAIKITNGKRKSKGEENWYHEQRSGEKNPLGMIPIIEWVRSDDRMGCFERQIDDMDALNILESDVCNATEEAVNSIWHCNDVDFPEEEIKNSDGSITKQQKTPQNNDWLQTYTSQDGKTPFVTPLSNNFDYEGNLNYIISKRSLILQKCSVPQRGSSAGGNTSLALDNANGWSAAESVAGKQQNIMEDCKMDEVKVVLRAIQKSPDVPPDSPLLKLKITDIQPSIKRQKNFELSTKINFFATAVSHGIYGLHALKAMNTFPDVNEVWEDSKPLIEAYQNSIFNKSDTANNAVGADNEQQPDSDRLMTDVSDQSNNSPNLDG